MISNALLRERYRVGPALFAHGGMGEVWLARDVALDRQVVVKLLPIKDADLLARFKREARLTAQLAHPGVAQILDLSTYDGYPYLVLEHIVGATLDHLASEAELPIPWVAAIGMQVCSVLMSAQKVGLVHRDLKPDNIMLTTSGAVKVLDFGLAAIPGDDRYSRITETGGVLGTPGYMAPEQIKAEPVDHRADLYSLGGTLYYLLTGEHPFDEPTSTATKLSQLADPPPHPADVRTDVPDSLDALVQALLAELPADRPQSALDVYTALGEHLGALPPIPGFVSGEGNPERAYAAAITGLAPSLMPPPPVPQPRQSGADEADRLFAQGKFRAAARMWRELADQYEHQYGEAHPRVFEWRRNAARAHIPMGERTRALRLLGELADWQARLVGPDHPTVRDLRRELDELRSG